MSCRRAQANTTVATVGDPVAVARAVRLAVEADRLGRRALSTREREAPQASTPMVGVPFCHQTGAW
ncbi:MAG: hypothetical protein HIU89_18430 [Proteobacteria bacterium]|nr:hypothetical protein [Pseudomonadota bacterium]